MCQAPPTCLTSLTQLTYSGYNYRTLYGATVDGTTTYNGVEQTYAAMPANYVVSPDDSNVASQVIKPHKWDVWRLCTDNKCYYGQHYGGSAGGVSDGSRFWEEDVNHRYRIKPGNQWYRLLIRAPCEAPDEDTLAMIMQPPP